MGEEVFDPSVYSMKQGHLWRTPNVQRADKRYKVGLYPEEAIRMTVGLYDRICSKPREPITPAPAEFSPEFSNLFQSAKEKVEREKVEKEQASLSNGTTKRTIEDLPPTLRKLMDGEFTGRPAKDFADRTTPGWNGIKVQLVVIGHHFGMSKHELIAQCAGIIREHQGDSGQSADDRKNSLREAFRSTKTYDFSIPAIRAILPKGKYPDLDALGNPENDATLREIERLASLSPIDYDRTRKEAAEVLGLRITTLDTLVSERRAERAKDKGADHPFDDVVPWHQPVQGDQLLSTISDAILQFIVCKRETAYAAALWAAMTWLMDVVRVAPLAIITAPEMGCGKSQLLNVLGKLARRPLPASNITPAALFRTIEAWQPTLLLDEADTFMRDNDELRGVIDSGHTLDSAFVVRTVGDDFEPKKFCTWGGPRLSRASDTCTLQ
jgi:hypothetical protein